MSAPLPQILTDSAADRPAPAAHAAYVEPIDGMRAVAVLGVMAYHLRASLLPGGFVGVDVFFVISGFVVALSVIRRPFRGPLHLLGQFYARRLTRIAPALVVMLLVTSAATVAFVPDAWLSRANGDTALRAFFGWSNILLARQQEDYFGPRSDFNPFIHTWSLGVEEQFYLLFPLLILPGLLLRSGGLRLSLALTALLSLVSLVASAGLTQRDPVYAFFHIVTRFWELGLGVALALGATAGNRLLLRLPAAAVQALAAVAALALAAAFLFANEGRFPFPWAVPPALGSALLLAVLFSRRPTAVTALLSLPPLRLVGRMSYSLYLWHWPVFVLMRWTVGAETPAQDVLAVGLTFAVAALSYAAVEQPVRRSATLRRQPRAMVVAGFLAVVLAGAGLTQAAFRHTSQLSLSVTTDSATWSPYLTAPSQPLCRIAVSNQPLLAASIVTLRPEHCSDRPRRRLFVAGDSHAGAYLRMLSRLAEREDVEVTLYQKAGCPFLNFRQPLSLLDPACAATDHAIAATIEAAAQPGDTIFLPSLRVARYRDQWGTPTLFPGPAIDATAIREAADFLTPLSARGVNLVLEAPKPVFPAPPFRCWDWFNRGNPVCRFGFTLPRAEADAHRAAVLDAERHFAATLPHVSVWDPMQVLCDAASCRADRDGVPMFFDGDHPSGAGNLALLDSFAAHLAAIR